MRLFTPEARCYWRISIESRYNAGVPIGKTASVSIEEKRQALDRLLASDTFSRSDKLKQFLRYICDMEIAGRVREVNEYLIGVDALGRPQDFSPSEDSIVRSTAYVLRQKLQEYYDREAPDELLRIDLPKGSYMPIYVLRDPEPARETLAPAVASAPIVPARDWKTVVIGFAVGAVLAAFATYLALISSVRRTALPDPLLAAAWGSLVAPNSNVMILLAHPPHFLVRQYANGVQPDESLPVPQAAYEWYRFSRGLPTADPNLRLFMYETGNSALMGDVFAAVAGAKTIALLGGSSEIVPERTVRLPAMGQRNAILVGNPEYSPAVSSLLADAPISSTYDTSQKLDVVIERQPGGGPPKRYIPRITPVSHPGESYGVLTVMPSARSNSGTYRTVVVSGVNSAGTQGAMEYFASPIALRELKAHLGGHFPDAYQVLIRCNTETSRPM